MGFWKNKGNSGDCKVGDKLTKRYYWLKLNENFFEREEIKVIENMKNGKDYIIFYLKLLLKSISTEGELKFRNIIPYTPEMLSAITGTDIDTVRVAIDLFTKLDLMEVWDDGTLFMIETQNMIGSETEWAKKKRLQREKQEELSELKDNVQYKEDNVPEVSSECPTDIDIDKELDIDKDTTIEKTATAPHEEIINMYNSICISFNPVKRITDKRKGSMNARYRENKNDIEVFRTVFNKVQNSTFLKGGWNTGGKADFDWILRPTNFVKVLEGKYDDKDIPHSKNKNISKLEQMYQEALAEEEGGLSD